MYRSGVNNSTKKATLPGCLYQIKGFNSMTTLTQKQPIKVTEDKHTAAFDVALSLPPAETSSDSEYFQAYIKEVVRTGNTPF